MMMEAMTSIKGVFSEKSMQVVAGLSSHVAVYISI